jgi:hypothetical protein
MFMQLTDNTGEPQNKDQIPCMLRNPNLVSVASKLQRRATVARIKKVECDVGTIHCGFIILRRRTASLGRSAVSTREATRPSLVERRRLSLRLSSATDFHAAFRSQSELLVILPELEKRFKPDPFNPDIYTRHHNSRRHAIRLRNRETTMTTQKQTLDFYSAPGPMTSAGRYVALFEPLPNDVGSLVRIIQSLTLHEFVASSMYGVTVPDDRKGESHIREAERMLDRILELDDRPFNIARPPERRLVGVCRHFVVLLLTMLHAPHIPSRCRCGFGSYFNPGFYEDHVVCEYWNEAEKRWLLADPQFDEAWRKTLKIEHDILDVPRDRFLVAADAWTACRTGRSDPATFGTINGNLRGLWFVAANLVHDIAALNKMEMLRWDVWGAMPHPDTSLKADDLAFFDYLTALTREPGESFEKLRRLYEDDDRLRVPSSVLNALRNRPESTLSPAA